jgi:hypothetical protein
MKWGAMKRIKIARIGLAVGSLTLAVLTTGAHAQEGVLVKNFLGAIGIISEDKEPINYRERPPLVLPPRMDLREPAAPGSAQARNGQWPNDPDVVARKKLEAEDRTPLTETEGHRMNGSNTRLSIDEMRAGRHAGAQVTTSPQVRKDNAWMHPDVLREMGTQGNSKVAGDDTARRSLTEPPSAYRRSATGQAIRPTWEAPDQDNEADPKVFLRKQQERNRQ